MSGRYWDDPRVTTRLSAIDILAPQFGAEVIFDDLGRRCVSREAARGLFAEREECERRRRELQERRDAQAAEQTASNPVWRGFPDDRLPAGVSAASAMLAAAKDAEPRRQSVLEHALANGGGFLEYHRVETEPQ